MNRYAASFDQVAPIIRLPLERWGGDAATRYNWQPTSTTPRTTTTF
jgi:hypothetical protein